ncbi:BREX-1 system adenine-specific DNA-methyltransferase PglX [Janthinobacterium rivuli]|uniref:BREX-1 system adenine-specific DNA-methyltransferase PglX n=1 Tax=Janthinobacterium rivuli TaxID=2751478 RepID=UPI00383A6479
MNKAKLKSYAPQARKDFIAAVTARANLLGLSEKAGKLEVAASQPQGDATVIAGQAWPVKVHSQRQQLITRIQKDGFSQTMEAVAYTWFNRFAALRYMELHDYLGHGHRALSSLEGTLPDILTHATDLVQNGAGNGGLPGLKPALVVEMKLAGNRDGELYRLLLIAQCNALSNVMPFLFERIDDETELLLPDNLLRTDSVIAKLVKAVDEKDWEKVEIIGWLYQFYISDKKNEVIGKVVKSEDIPAATQLFTPSWIVQYLVQNSVGRLWMLANPASALGGEWPFFVKSAVQTTEVQEKLDALIQTRINLDGGALNPESITVLDPACGSGHILVETYELLKSIYLERGYQPRSIPRLILEKNLFGLDIDDRAAQMAGFALVMKARADDRNLFNDAIRLNVMSLQESNGIDLDDIATHLAPFGVKRASLANLLNSFSHAKTFGSLIKIPLTLKTELPSLADGLQLARKSGDLYANLAALELLPLVSQAFVLAMKLDAIVANPPYMGGKSMNLAMKEFAKKYYPDSKSDLFSMFMERGFKWCGPSSFNSMVTMHSWMFLSSHQVMREKLLQERTFQTLAHLGPRAFSEISGEVVQTAAFVMQEQHLSGFRPVFFRLIDGQEEQKETALRSGQNRFDAMTQDDFRKIPGSPMAFWVSNRVRESYENNPSIGDISPPRTGISTGKNGKYILRWYEIDFELFGIGKEGKSIDYKYYPHNKGGDFRKWYGNQTDVLKYSESDIADMKLEDGFRHDNEKLYFLPSISWTKITSSHFNARWYPQGFTFNSASVSIYSLNPELILGYLNSSVFSYLTKAVSQTLNFTVGDIAKLPVVSFASENHEVSIKKLIEISKWDWDSLETSWNFSLPPFIINGESLLSESWKKWSEKSSENVAVTQELERINNQFFIKAYGFQGELSSEFNESPITLNRADREKDCQRLISYIIACMMGRYSLDAPGMIYAKAGNLGFDASRYTRFPADADGIVPLTDEHWYDDEAAIRIRQFLLAVWGADTVAQNMAWLAESIGIKIGETPEEAIRRYLAEKFYKDHLQVYKNRPIYWLFSSGRLGAFQALVYLHRYHEGTLARLRAEYVVPLTGKIQSRIDMLEKDAAAADSTAARNKLTKEAEKFKKKHVELLAYDEQLRHHADMRITLDLDDGVKVNYGKFGNLLAEVKAVTGGASDD